MLDQAFDTCKFLDEDRHPKYMGVRRILQGLIIEMRAQVIVEIGAFRGYTAVCMGLSAKKWGGKVYTIESNPDKNPRKVIHNMLGKKSRVKLIEKRCEKVKEEDIERPIDLLFIDGDHTYEGTKRAFDKFYWWMRPGGLIVMHDITVRKKTSGGEEYGVWKFWDEIKLEKFAIAENRPGIGFVRVPS